MGVVSECLWGVAEWGAEFGAVEWDAGDDGGGGDGGGRDSWTGLGGYSEGVGAWRERTGGGVSLWDGWID